MTGKIWIFYDSEKKRQTKPMSLTQAQVVLMSLAQKNLSRFFMWTPGWEQWVSIAEYLDSSQTYFVGTQPPQPVFDIAVDEEGSAVIDDDKTVRTNTGVAEHTITTTNSYDTPYTQVTVGEQPSKEGDYGYYFADFNGDQLDLAKIKKIKSASTKKKAPAHTEPDEDSDRRRAIRHSFKIEVLLVGKAGSFRTKSKNISLSGTLLEKEIPKDFLNKPFDLIIVNPFETNLQKGRLLFKAKIVGDLTDPRRLMFIEKDREMTSRLEALLKAYIYYQEQVKNKAG